MSHLTYYVALPFIRTEDGRLVAARPVEATSRTEVVFLARNLLERNDGAIAFARSGDPAFSADAEIIAKFGAVPEDLSEL